MEFKLDLSEIDDLAEDIDVMRKVGFRFAARDTLNTSAFNQREKMQAQIRKDFTLRNRYTERGIMVTRSPNINYLLSEVGSKDEYMARQESGGTVYTKPGNMGVAIPTSYSAGLSMDAKPRTKMPRKSNKIGFLSLTKTSRNGKNRKQRNIFAMQTALKKGKKHVYMELSRGNRKGIFRILGGKRKPKVKMVVDLTRKSVPTPKSPWLLRSLTGVGSMISRIYTDMLDIQIKKRKLFLSKR